MILPHDPGDAHVYSPEIQNLSDEAGSSPQELIMLV